MRPKSILYIVLRETSPIGNLDARGDFDVYFRMQPKRFKLKFRSLQDDFSHARRRLSFPGLP
jgi:hypothetical protein